MRRFSYTGGEQGYIPDAPEPPAEITVDWAWVGGVSSTTAKVNARSADADAMTLEYSTAPNFAGSSTASGSEGSDEVWSFALSGLAASTLYYYRFDGGDIEGQFRTFPTEGSEASFTIAAASCAGSAGAQYKLGISGTSNPPTFDHIREIDPAVFIHMGDRHYRDINSSDVSLHRAAYNAVMQNPRQLAMHLAMPVAYTWDDHDWGGDDSNKNSSSKTALHQVYREHVPSWDLEGVNDEIHQTFVIGRVRFILLDDRSERYPNGSSDPAKTALGVDQKAWLKALLLAATEPVIVLMTGFAWIGTSNSTSWNAFSAERIELAEFWEDNSLTERLILLNGDNHQLTGDDGTNSQYDSGSANPGPMVCGFAPMDAGITAVTGTWSHGTFGTRRQQFGTLAFSDEGDEIVVTVRAWSVTDATRTQKFVMTKSFAA